MTHGDGTTVGVDLLQGKTAVLDGVDSLGSESLVDLKDIDILDLDADLLEDGGDGNGGTDTHGLGLASNNCGGDVLADNVKSELLSGLALHQENGGSTIRDLGGVTGSGGTIEGRAELGQALDGGTGTDTVILGDGDLLLVTLGILDDGLDGDDLMVELALGLSAGSLAEGKSSELVLLLTGDVVLGGDVLGGDTLEKKKEEKRNNISQRCPLVQLVKQWIAQDIEMFKELTPWGAGSQQQPRRPRGSSRRSGGPWRRDRIPWSWTQHRHRYRCRSNQPGCGWRC